MQSIAFIQVRLGSRRLPGKALLPIDGVPSLAFLIERVRRASSIKEVVISTSPSPEDDLLVEFGREHGALVCRHPVDDIVGRLHQAAHAVELKPDFLVRFWGDSPLVCADMIDRAVEQAAREGLQFLATGLPKLTYPAGLDFELFSAGLLDRLERECVDPYHREFPAEFMKAHPEIRFGGMPWKEDLHKIELSIDYQEDLEVVRRLVADLRGTGQLYSSEGIMEYCKMHPELFDRNGSLERNIEFKQKKKARGEE